MFGNLFGWHKASKCKKQIKRLQCRLKLLKNKRGSMFRQSRQDIAQLVKLGHNEAAMQRANQLLKDESIMAVYELLDCYCEFILIHMPYIRRSRDCPNDIKEAVSSLIYASARCGDLPELLVIRELFGERYGQGFANSALELVPGNLVHPQLKEQLSIQSVSEYVKRRLVDEITEDYCLQPVIPAIEYPSEFMEDSTREIPVEDQTTVTDGKPIYIGSLSSTRDSFIAASHSRQGSDTATTSAAASISLQSSPRELETPVHSQVESFTELYKRDHSTAANLENKEIQGNSKSYNTNFEDEEEKVTSSTSSESSIQFIEEPVVYLDDVEEYQSFLSHSGYIQDQRLFRFKSSMPQNIRISRGRGNQNDSEEYQSGDEEQRSFTTRWRLSGEKLRSVSREIHFNDDTDCAYYYVELPSKNLGIPKHQSPSRRKVRKMTTLPQQQSCCLDTRSTPLSSYSIYQLNHKTDYCISKNPNRGDLRSPLRQKIYIKDSLASRYNYSSSSMYNVFTYLDHYPGEQTLEKLQGIQTPEKSSSCYKDTPTTNRNSTREELQPPYMKAMTMPLEMNKDGSNSKMARSNTCLTPQPNHVHPKLPDYDDLAAKFLAFKKEHIKEKKAHEDIAD